MRVLFILGLLFFTACSKENCKSLPVGFKSSEPIRVERKEKELFAANSEEEVLDFLKNNPGIAKAFLQSDQYPDLTILSSRIYQLINDPYIDTVYRESVNAFDESSATFIGHLNQAYDLMAHYFPGSKKPVIQTMVTGLFQDLYISDSLIIIGIDFFIGPNATFKPLDIPQYILKRYDYNYLPSTIMGFATIPYVETGKENTLMGEMIDYGKTYYLSKLLLPCIADDYIIGYTSEELNDVIYNQEIIWASFIENEVLFDTNEFMKRKFLGERPNVYEIGEKCPGRIGAWLGWQIVKDYMDNYPSTLQEMLSSDEHHLLFENSGYKPKNGKN